MHKQFVPEDLGRFQDIGQLDTHPGKDVAACVVRSVSLDSDSYASVIWCFELDGSNSRRFTQGTGNDTSPRWSPDGKTLAFVSTRGALPQVHLMPGDGGEARTLSNLPNGAGRIEW